MHACVWLCVRACVRVFVLSFTMPTLDHGIWTIFSCFHASSEYAIKESKKMSNDQELIQSDPISCPQNQKGNN